MIKTKTTKSSQAKTLDINKKLTRNNESVATEFNTFFNT